MSSYMYERVQYSSNDAYNAHMKSGAAYGNSSGAAYGIASGASYGKSSGAAYGASSGAFYGNSSGAAYGNSSGAAYGNSSGAAYGAASGAAYGNSSGAAYGNSSGAGYGNSAGAAYGHSSGAAYGNASGGAYRNSAGAAYGNASGFAFDGSSGGYDYQGYGGGKMAAGGQMWSGGGHAGEYSSNGGQMIMAGGGSSGFQMHENKAQIMAAETTVESDGLISALVPTSFPPGTDPKFVECFNSIDKDRSGSICAQELQSALTTFQQRFSLRTVHLLMFLFTGSNMKDVTPKEFVPLIRCLQSWKSGFEMHDRDKNGCLDEMELRDAMLSMGYNLSPFVLKLLVSKFDKTGSKFAIEYDYFIECCLIIRGLTEKFRAKEDPYTGNATFSYDQFLLTILPFITMN